MGKKGQLTIFIIVGVLIVFLMAMAIIIVSSIGDDVAKKEARTEAKGSASEDSIRIYVQEILKESVVKSIYHIALKGGKNEVPVFSPKEAQTTITGDIVAYGLRNDVVLLDKEDFEAELGEAIRISIEEELKRNNRLEFFKNRGIDIVEQYADVMVTITDTKVLINLDFPIEASIEGNMRVIDHYSTEINVDLGKMIQAGIDVSNKLNDATTYNSLDISPHDDYSCDMIRVCNEDQGKMIVVKSLKRWEGENDLVLQFAIDKGMNARTCTKFTKFEMGLC